VTPRDIPADISRDWVLPDGRVRVQVVPKPNIQAIGGLDTFTDQVTAIARTRVAQQSTIAATSLTIVDAFRTAAIGAVLAVLVILSLTMRRILDVVLVMMPLVLSALLTLYVAVLLSLPLNFANIIALPLLLGVGVSFNVYFVMNWRAGQTNPLARRRRGRSCFRR